MDDENQNLEGELDSSQIIDHLRAGGADALNQLFSKLRPQLRAMVEARLDRRLLPRVDASDIVQETFVRATSGLASYLSKPKLHPIVWLRLLGKRIMFETYRHHFRDKRTPDRETHFEEDGSDLIINNVADSMMSVGSKLDHVQMALQVRETLSQLAAIDREIIEMRHIEGLTIHEAADVLELSYETTKKRYFRAIKRFREYAEHLK